MVFFFGDDIFPPTKNRDLSLQNAANHWDRKHVSLREMIYHRRI